MAAIHCLFSSEELHKSVKLQHFWYSAAPIPAKISFLEHVKYQYMQMCIAVWLHCTKHTDLKKIFFFTYLLISKHIQLQLPTLQLSESESSAKAHDVIAEGGGLALGSSSPPQ